MKDAEVVVLSDSDDESEEAVLARGISTLSIQEPEGPKILSIPSARIGRSIFDTMLSESESKALHALRKRW